MIAILTLIGAFLYRWRGMAHPLKKYTPRPLSQIAFALPYAFAVYFYYYPITGNWAFLIAAAALIVTTLGILAGHGQYFLPSSIKAILPERVDFIVKWFFGDDPRTRKMESSKRL